MHWLNLFAKFSVTERTAYLPFQSAAAAVHQDAEFTTAE